MTTTHPTHPIYTLVLLQHADQTWSAEPVNMGQVANYHPGKAGGLGCYRRSADLNELVHTLTRQALADALACDFFAFDLRFCLSTGECVARSEVMKNTVLPDGGRGTTVMVYVADKLAERVKAAQLR